MNTPQELVYASLLMAVSIGMTAWRVAAHSGKVGAQVDHVLGACLAGSIGLFVVLILPYYLPGYRLR